MSSKNVYSRSEVSEFVEKVIKINRVTKVCKGGKRLAFRALVIVGDLNGRVSIGLGKAKEVPSAIRKAMDRAKKDMVNVGVVGGTIPHEVIGKFGSAKVIMKPAPQGTGVIAGGSIRILLESVGLKNVVAKSLGSDNHVNTAKAAMHGLLSLKNVEQESLARGKKLLIRSHSGNDFEDTYMFSPPKREKTNSFKKGNDRNRSNYRSSNKLSDKKENVSSPNLKGSNK